MMYSKMSRAVSCYPLSLYSTSVADHFITIMRIKLLFTIHHKNIRLETDVVC